MFHYPLSLVEPKILAVADENKEVVKITTMIVLLLLVPRFHNIIVS